MLWTGGRTLLLRLPLTSGVWSVVFSFSTFTPMDLIACRKELGALGRSEATLEDVAGELVKYIYDAFRVSDGGDRSCALVRFYLSQPYAALPADLKEFARAAAGERPVTGSTRCLILLATTGDEEAWNSRHSSVGHQAIPLVSEEAVEQIPMVAQLIRQLGLDVGHVVSPDRTVLVDFEKKTFNVFHVEEALGSPYIPAQEEFVVPYGIRSVLGFGGVLPMGEMFSVIAFSRVPISEETARMFRPLTLSTKLALLRARSGVFS